MLAAELRAPSQVAAAQLGAAKQLGPLRALHFQPSGWPHAVTAVLPLPPTASAAAEDALQGRRLLLHRRLSAFSSGHPLSLQLCEKSFAALWEWRLH